MNQHKKHGRISSHGLHILAYKYSPWIAIASIIVVFVATLFPFNFSFNLISEMGDLPHAFRHPTDLNDSVNNILLFIPFGFALTAFIKRYRASIVTLLLVIFIASAGLSFTVECLQILLPSRATTIADVINNSIGGLVGLLCFHLWKYRIIKSIWQLIETVQNSLSVKNVTVAAIAYTIFYLTVAGSLPIATSLSNWNPQYYLQLGNEATGDRAWSGYISELAIANQAISEEEVARTFTQNRLLSANHPALIADYQFVGDDNFTDTTGNAPQLSWQGKPEITKDSQGIFLSSHQWLKTVKPATNITEKIRLHSQFTFSTTFKAKYTYQDGLTRIISLSQDVHTRNFTLSQDKSHLVLRMRTPMSGNNGTNPQLVVPNFFADGKNHHLIITYNGYRIKFYIDSITNAYTFNFHPGFAFFNFLAFLGSGWYLYLDGSYQIIYNSIYYSWIFIIWGILLGLLTNIVASRILSRFVLVPTLILLPPIILESLLSHQSGVDWQWQNAIGSMAIAWISMTLFKLKVKPK